MSRSAPSIDLEDVWSFRPNIGVRCLFIISPVEYPAWTCGVCHQSEGSLFFLIRFFYYFIFGWGLVVASGQKFPIPSKRLDDPERENKGASGMVR